MRYFEIYDVFIELMWLPIGKCENRYDNELISNSICCADQVYFSNESRVVEW